MPDHSMRLLTLGPSEEPQWVCLVVHPVEDVWIGMLVAALEAFGSSVFWDRTIPTGKTWRQVIANEIRNSRSVVVVWIRDSVESEWLKEETEERKRRNALLPMLLDDVDPPSGFGAPQIADLTRRDDSSGATLFRGMAQDILRVLGMPKPARLCAARLTRYAGCESV